MPEKIVIVPNNLRDRNYEATQSLRDQGYALAFRKGNAPITREELGELLADAVGLIVGSEAVTRELLTGAEKLRVVSRHGVGYDSIDLEAATELGVVVTFIPDAMVASVADLALGLMLAAARRIPEFDAAVKAGGWPRALGTDIHDATLGIVGTGRIGLAVAKRARAFDMRLVGYDPCPNPRFITELGGEYRSLPEVLAISDFVTLHLPALPSTRGLIGEEELARMKPGAFLINAARGSVVDEAALLGALRQGRLAGAGLDVYTQEPIVPGTPAAELAALPNVVALPHVASLTPTTQARMDAAAVENLLAVLSGKRPAHVANPEVYKRGPSGAEPSPCQL